MSKRQKLSKRQKRRHRGKLRFIKQSLQQAFYEDYEFFLMRVTVNRLMIHELNLLN